MYKYKFLINEIHDGNMKEEYSVLANSLAGAKRMATRSCLYGKDSTLEIRDINDFRILYAIRKNRKWTVINDNIA